MTSSNHEYIRVVYDGPALATHRMDVRDLAPALIAFSDLLKASNKVVNRDAADIRVHVNGNFSAGSFGIDLVASQQWLSQLKGLLSGNGATAISNAYTLISLLGLAGGGLIGLLRTLKGMRPVRLDPHGDQIRVWLSETDFMDTESTVIALFDDIVVRACLEKMLSPLDCDGITEMRVVSKDQIVLSIRDDELAAFRFVRPGANVASDTTVRKILLIEAMTFTEPRTWRVHDGTASFDVSIEDAEFLARIEAGERFGNADILFADIRQIQYFDGPVLVNQSSIVKVLEHKRRDRVVRVEIDSEPTTKADRMQPH